MRAVCFWLGLVFAVGCRGPLPPIGVDAGRSDGGDPLDLATPALPDCTKAADCNSCCNGVYTSGGLVFDTETRDCACTASPCASACATTVCGNLPGATAACLACIAGLSVDGGACQAGVNECLQTYESCGSWRTCVESCPGAGTS